MPWTTNAVDVRAFSHCLLQKLKDFFRLSNKTIISSVRASWIDEIVIANAAISYLTRARGKSVNKYTYHSSEYCFRARW